MLMDVNLREVRFEPAGGTLDVSAISRIQDGPTTTIWPFHFKAVSKPAE
jgi:hypothetical protein